MEEKKPESRLKAAQYGFLALIFLALTLLLFLGFRTDKALTTSLQKIVFPLGISLLLSGLVTLLFYIQLDDRKEVAKKGPLFYPVFSGVLAVVCMFLALSYMGVYPVGEKSTMIVDMHHQYAPLLSHLKDRILHGGGFLYDFEVGLGVSFLPLFGYYLSSPLNLLLCLFPDSMLTDGILVITLIKVGLAAAFFAACLQYIYHRRDLSVVACSLMYAMMMYTLAYFWNIMWLDVVMILPLVVMCFEKLMREGKYLPYILTLAYALYANYYIGFMLCLFMVLYFLFYLLRRRRTLDRVGKSFLRFAVGSLIGGGLVMFLLLPVAAALGDTSAAGGSMPEMTNNFDMFNLLGRHLYDVTPTIRSGNLPNIYCGILPLFLLPVFITQKSIPLRRRLAFTALLAVVGFSFVLNQFDLLWHGLHSPNDLPYRFSFLYSFVLILIAYETLTHLQWLSLKSIVVSFVAILTYLVIEERFGDDAYGFDSIYISLLLALIYAVIAVLVSRGKLYWRPATCLLLLVVTAEMVFNGGAVFQTLNNEEYFTKRADYVDNDNTRAIQKGVDRMKELGVAAADGAFYRMEFLPRRTCVDTALFDYRGMTVFASSNPYNLTKYMGGIGYAVNGVNSHLYRDFVVASDSLLGIRYVMLKDDAMPGTKLKKLETITEGSATYTIYENPYALPVAYFVQPGIESWEYTKYNPIASLNTLFSALTGNGEDMYTTLPINVESGSSATGRASGTTSFTVTPLDNNKTAKFVADIVEEGQYYIYVDCGAAKSISVSGAEKKTWSVNKSEPYMIDAGVLAAGTQITVAVTADSTASGNIYVAKLNDSVFEQNMATLSAHGMEVTEFTESRLTGTVTAPSDGVIYTSIPYDKGWSVTVDGQKVETFAGGNAMLAFHVGSGTHSVEISFFPRGLVPGIIISLVSLAALVALMLYIRRSKRGRVPATVTVPNGPYTPQPGPYAQPSEPLPAAESTSSPSTQAPDEHPDVPPEEEKPAGQGN